MSKLQNVTTPSALLGAVLIKLRNKKGMKQQELAAALNIGPSTWSRIEKGESGLSIDQLRKVAELLDETPGRILEMLEFAECEAKTKGIEVVTGNDPEKKAKRADGIEPYTLIGSEVGKIMWRKAEYIEHSDMSEILSLLNNANQDERKALGEILFGADGGRNCSAARLTEALCDAGGHSIANMFRGHGVSYAEIVDDVYTELKITGAKPSGYVETESAIVGHMFNKIFDSMTPAQKAELLEELKKLGAQYGTSFAGLGIAGGTLAVGGAAGFQTYLMATLALSAFTGALGIALPFAAYTGLTSTLGVILGPVGWIGLAAYGTYALGKPNFKKTIPSVMLISAIRSRLKIEGK